MQPFYLYLAMQNVHAPIEVPARFEALYDGVIRDSHRKKIADMVSALDEAVANVTQALPEASMWQDTLLLFNFDNGGPLGSATTTPSVVGSLRTGMGGVRIQAFLYSPRLDIITTRMVRQPQCNPKGCYPFLKLRMGTTTCSTNTTLPHIGNLAYIF